MGWLEILRTGWDAVRTHRLRSALTMLGILIGIAGVVMTVGLGEGAQQKVSSQISALGSNLLIVSPGSLNPRMSLLARSMFSRWNHLSATFAESVFRRVRNVID